MMNVWTRSVLVGRRARGWTRNSSRVATVSENKKRAVGGTMPTVRGLPLIGTTLSILAAGSAPKLHEYIDSRHRQLGPVFREKLGPVDAVIVSDPEAMRRVFALEGKYPVHFLPESWVQYNELYGSKRGLFFMDGEEWLQCRRAMNNLLMRADSGRALTSPCTSVATHLVDRWGSRDGAELRDLEGDLYCWAIEAMLAVLMGEEAYVAHRQQLHHTIVELAANVHQVFEKSAQLSLVPAKLALKLKLRAWTSFVEVVDRALNIANSLVEQILPVCQGGEGLLGRMAAQDMKHDVVLRVVADLVLAAGDTTTYAMEWALYSLAKHSDIQDQLYEELSGLSDSEKILQLPILKAVLREVLRLYPISPFLTRKLPEDSFIGGYPVKAGQLVLLSLYTSGRDEANFANPSAFWPQRWLRDANGSYLGVKSPYASLPFAMGARSCVGRKMAEIQILLTIAKIVKTFKMALVDSEQVDVILRLVTVPSKPIRIKVMKR